MSGPVSYHAGLSAEAAVANHYHRQGFSIAEQRWRGSRGELDLVLRDGEGLIFVEVKKSRSFSSAAERLSKAQMKRIWATASEFLANEPNGQNTSSRFDVALVDGYGQIQVIENVMPD